MSVPGTRLNRYSSRQQGTGKTRAKRRSSRFNWELRATDNGMLAGSGVVVAAVVVVAVSGERAWDAGDKGPKSRHRVGQVPRLYRDRYLAEEKLEHWSEEGGRQVIRGVRVLLSLVSIRQRYLVRSAGPGSCPCGGGLSLDVEARAACSRKHPRTGQRKHQALWSSSQPATLHNALERAETLVL